MQMQRLQLPSLYKICFLFLMLCSALGNSWAQGCSQPSNLTSSVTAPGTVTLSWSAAGGARAYTLQYRLGNSGVWTSLGGISRTSQTLSGLIPERVYNWRVKANCSTYSSVASFNAGGGISGNVDCSSPSNQEASGLSATSVRLTWSASQGSFYYNVRYRLTTATAWTTTGNISGTATTLTGLLSNREYEWQVKASCSVYSSIAKFNLVSSSGGGGSNGGGSTSCSAPSNTNTTPLTATAVQVSWEPQGGAINYTVQYRLATSTRYITVGTVNNASARITGLATGQEYVWRVKANCSPYGSDVQFSTPSSAVNAFTASTNTLDGQAPLRIFPNPVTTNTLHIQAADYQEGQVWVINSAGQVVLNEVLKDQQQTLDVSQLKNGLYFVRLSHTNGASQTQKLVIVH